MLRLALLWWKDWKWQKRNWGYDIALLLIPLLFSGGITKTQWDNYRPYHQEEALMAHERLIHPVVNYVPPFKIAIFLPNKGVNEQEFQKFCWEYCRGYRISTYQSEAQIVQRMNDAIKNGFTGFVVIETWDLAAPLLKYRLVSTNWSLQKNLAPHWGLWSVDQQSSERTRDDLTAAITQQLIDSHFYSQRQLHKKGSTSLPTTKPNRRSFRGLTDLTVHHAAMPLFNPSAASVTIILGQVISFSALLGVWRAAKQFQADREAKTKFSTPVLLEQLGIGRLQYFFSFAVPLFFKFFLMQVTTWAPPLAMLKGAFDIHTIISGSVIYALVLTSFSLLMGVVFHKQMAVKLGSTGLMVLMHCSQMGQTESSYLRKHSMLASIVFPSAFYYYLRAATTRLAVGGFVPDFAMSSVEAALLLLLSGFVMFLLTLYFDTIYPGDGRKGLHFGFPFLFRYWVPSTGPPVYESEDLMREVSVVEAVDPKTSQTSVAERLSTLSLDGVCKYLNGMWTVNRVTMKFHLNELTVLYGPRGSGGREILNLIAGRMVPDNGEVIMTKIEGGADQTIALSTSPGLVPNMTVAEMVSWVTRIRGAEEVETDYMLEDLSLKEIENTKVSELNITQRQQLNLLLAFVGDSDVVLLDEPTANCSPGVRTSMHAFIMARKTSRDIAAGLKNEYSRTVIMSTYDPIDAEIGDSVAFLSYGHLVACGTMQGIRDKYINSVNIIVWPTETFGNNERTKIQRVINSHIKDKDLRRASYEIMPNDSVRFLVKNNSNIPYHTIVDGLEKQKEELGIRYAELQRHTVQDAYINCIRKDEFGEDELDSNVLAVPLEKFYNNERDNSIFPELVCMFKLRLSYIKANALGYAFSIIVPIMLILFTCLLVFIYNQTAHEMEIGPVMLEKGLSIPARIFSNIPLRNELPMNVKIIKENHRDLLTGERLFDEPPIVAGVYRNNETNMYHLYSMKMLRFADMMAQNMLINSIIDTTTDKQVVHTWIQGPESPKWATLQLPSKEDDMAPGLSLSRRHLATMLVRQWLAVLLVGGVATAMLAKAGMQIARMSSDNGIEMLYLSGARPVFFWLAVSIVDTLMFLLLFVIATVPLAVVANVPGAVLGVSIFLSLLTFVTFLPFIYCCALKIQDSVSTYVFSLLLLAPLAILPCSLLIDIRQYGLALEESCAMAVLVAFICPPLAAALSVAIMSDMVGVQQMGLGAAFGHIFPMILASCIHVWLWLVLIMFNAPGIRRMWTKFQFKYQQLTLNPKKFADTADNNMVNIRTGPLISETEQKEESGGSTDVEGARKKAGGPSQVSGKSDRPTLTSNRPPSNVSGRTPQSEKPSEKQSEKPQSEKPESEKPQEDKPVLKTEVGPKGPLIEFSKVTVDHYKDKSLHVNMALFDSQILNVFGDLPTIRSSLLDMAAGQSHPKTGKVIVEGKQPGNRSNCGYVPQDDRLCSFLTGRETLRLVAKLKKYKEPTELINYMLKVTELEQMADVYVRKYGVSDRRMLQFAVTVLHRPSALILDEVDMYVSPTRMKTIWAMASFLRKKCNVPIFFSTPRVWECEVASTHTAMLNQGAVVLADPTPEVKKRFSSLCTLTLTLKKDMDVSVVMQVIVSQLQCETQPHPNPEKMSFLLKIAPNKHVETMSKVRSLMTTIGIHDYQLDAPDLDIIYHANFNSYIVL